MLGVGAWYGIQASAAAGAEARHGGSARTQAEVDWRGEEFAALV